MAPPNQYRPIQPAPGKSSAASTSSWLAKGLTKRFKAVTQACHTCRRNKAKVRHKRTQMGCIQHLCAGADTLTFELLHSATVCDPDAVDALPRAQLAATQERQGSHGKRL
jgi:hypothetical protein